MKVVIIEDEHLTADRIRTILLRILPGIQVLSILDSVKSSVQWFQQNERPDLVLMDIQLADGLSFDIFEQVSLTCPVIFLTAYQEYAIKAFKVNSVDYLLKPVTEEGMKSAVDKYQQYFSQREPTPLIGSELLNSIRMMINQPYKTRFMVRVGERIKSIEAENILYFFSLQKGTYLHTSDGRNYVIDFTLDALVEVLDPALFHRINRTYIVSHKAIKEMITVSTNKIKMMLIDSEDSDIYISRDRLAGFKKWLDQ